MVNLYEMAEMVYRLEQQGKHIIKFNVGDPDQPTDKRIIDACYKAMKTGKTKYGSAYGELTLRKALAEEHGVKPENIFITPGSKWAVFLAMRTLLGSGDNVIIPSPHWSAYALIAKFLCSEVRTVNTHIENDWRLNLEDVENAIDHKSKAIILCNPSNPTSKVIDPKTVAGLVDLAGEKDIRIISDECYADIAFKNVKSVSDFGSQNLSVHSFSKTFSMTGWRLGYIIADKQAVEKFAGITQITLTNVPVFIQDAALEALKLKSRISSRIRSVYKKRTFMAMRMLKDTHLRLSKPDAPFYLFPRCGENADTLAAELIGKGVAITPGSSFGDYKDYFRIALTLPEKDIEKGLKILSSRFGQ